MEAHVTSYIDEHPGAAPSELAAYWSRTNGFISQILKKLEEKGFIIRTRSPQNAKRVLLYLYSPSRLKRDLSDERATELLRAAGYSDTGAERSLVRLIGRLRCSEDFPHEIGLFLSYPPEDVKGFIEHKAADFKYSGLWKVYGDEKKAKELFDKYKKCTDIYCRLSEAGFGIEQLAVAV